MASQLNLNDQLTAGQQLTSPAGYCTLIMQNNDDLVLLGGSGQQTRVLWHSITVTVPSIGQQAYVWMQNDGNLCIYNPAISSHAQWASNTWQPQVTSGYAQVTDAGQLEVIVNGQITASFPGQGSKPTLIFGQCAWCPDDNNCQTVRDYYSGLHYCVGWGDFKEGDWVQFSFSRVHREGCCDVPDTPVGGSLASWAPPAAAAIR